MRAFLSQYSLLFLLALSQKFRLSAELFRVAEERISKRDPNKRGNVDMDKRLKWGRRLFSGGLVALVAAGQAQAEGVKPDFASSGTVKVCTAGDFAPMQYYKSPGDTNFVGFEIDVVDAIAKRWARQPNLLSAISRGCCPLSIAAVAIWSQAAS
jgi:hypothetical protein